MSKRNILQEILDKKVRSECDERLKSYILRTDCVRNSHLLLMGLEAKESKTINPELSRYYPVAIVAGIEGYFRSAIADLINSGTPFIERVTNLSNVKLNLDIAAAIQKKEISLGDYVSHFLSISSLDDINKAMSALLEVDFIDHVCSSEFELYTDEDPISLRENRDDFIKSIKELFTIRHLICHEYSNDLYIDNGKILRFFVSAEFLVSFTEVILVTAIHDSETLK